MVIVTIINQIRTKIRCHSMHVLNTLYSLKIYDTFYKCNYITLKPNSENTILTI